MICTLIPAKSFSDAKQRLSAVASPQERAAIARNLLTRTVKTVRTALGDAPIMVVTDDPAVAQVAREAGADNGFVSEQEGLNGQLSHASLYAPNSADLLVLHADLPLLGEDDLHALLKSTAPVTIAPDRRGVGTNALLLRNGVRYFFFGQDSAARHRQGARLAGVPCNEVQRKGLSFDLDEEADWHDLPADVRAALYPDMV